MGTRADFYIGRDLEAVWLGSIGWDGYPEGIPDELRGAKTEKDFRRELKKFFIGRTDVTLPDNGWPWPWSDSCTTDYAYAFDNGHVYACPFGRAWYRATWHPNEAWYDRHPSGQVVFPDMRARQNVTFGERSGLIVIG